MYLDIAILCLCCLSLLMHSLGFYLLICMYHTGRKTGQKLYLINFSLFETVKATIGIALVSIALFFSTSEVDPSPLVISIQHHLSILSETMLTFIYYSLLFYITIERLMTVVLGMKYCIYKGRRQSRNILISTWSIGCAIGLLFCLLYGLYGFYYIPYNHFVYVFLDILFIIIAVITYSTLFKKHVKSCSFRVHQNGCQRSTRSYTEIYRQSNFHIPVLLMSSFLFLMIVPDLVYVVMVCYQSHLSGLNMIRQLSSSNDLIWHCMIVLNVLSDIANALIYIFAEKRHRKKLIEMLAAVLKKLNINMNIQERMVSIHQFIGSIGSRHCKESHF